MIKEATESNGKEEYSNGVRSTDLLKIKIDPYSIIYSKIYSKGINDLLWKANKQN